MRSELSNLRPILFAVLMIAFSACQSSSSPTPSPGPKAPPKSWLVGANGQMLSINAQGEVLAHNSVTSMNLSGLTCVNKDTAWAVGDQGLILYTTDGGQQWNTQTTPTSENLRSVSFASATHGIVVGDHNTILVTDDAGGHWQIANTPVSGHDKTLWSVKLAVQAGVSFAVGDNGLALQSKDGGRNWNFLNTLQNASTLRSVDASADGTKAIAVGDGGMAFLLNTQGGQSLEWQTVQTQTLYTVHFLSDENTVVAAGADGVALTGTLRLQDVHLLTTGTKEDLLTLMVNEGASDAPNKITLAGRKGVIVFFPSITDKSILISSPSNLDIFSIDDLTGG